MEALVGLQHRFLGQVFGVEVIAAQSQCPAIQRVAHRNDLTFEPCNQLTIIRPSLDRLSTRRCVGGTGHAPTSFTMCLSAAVMIGRGAVLSVLARRLRCLKTVTVRSATHSVSHSNKLVGPITPAALNKVMSANLIATRFAPRSVQATRSAGSTAMPFRICCWTANVVIASRKK